MTVNSLDLPRSAQELGERVAGAARRLTRDASLRLGRSPVGGRVQATAAITVRRPVEDVYAHWRDFANWPSFMHHLESVQLGQEGRSHWKAKAPFGSVEWDAEIAEERPDELIAWRSLPGSDVEHSGAVRFQAAPRDLGTEIHVEMSYAAPVPAAVTALAKLTGEEPRQQLKDDLRRFKQVMETGEVVRSDGSPEGDSARRMLKQRPAQPLEEAPA